MRSLDQGADRPQPAPNSPLGSRAGHRPAGGPESRRESASNRRPGGKAVWRSRPGTGNRKGSRGGTRNADSGTRRMNIPEHRKAIDKLDEEIVRLLNERTRHV